MTDKNNRSARICDLDGGECGAGGYCVESLSRCQYAEQPPASPAQASAQEGLSNEHLYGGARKPWAGVEQEGQGGLTRYKLLTGQGPFSDETYFVESADGEYVRFDHVRAILARQSALGSVPQAGRVEDHRQFEAWTKTHGGLRLDSVGETLQTDDGLALPTYRFGRTEIAWRAWAASRARIAAPHEQAERAAVPEGWRDAIDKAAWILDGYSEYLQKLSPINFDEHPYIPSIAETANDLRAMLAAAPSPAPAQPVAQEGYQLMPTKLDDDMLRYAMECAAMNNPDGARRIRAIYQFLLEAARTKVGAPSRQEGKALDSYMDASITLDAATDNLYGQQEDNALDGDGQGRLCFVRFGHKNGAFPESGLSRNSMTGSLENGVSVYEALERNGSYQIILPAIDGTASATLSNCLNATQGLWGQEQYPLYEVAGDVVGTGSDGEPLLTNCRIVKRIFANTVSPDQQTSAQVDAKGGEV